jgi:hypothetical protein
MSQYELLPRIGTAPNIYDQRQAQMYFNQLSDERDRIKGYLNSKSCWFNPSYTMLTDDRTHRKVKPRTIYIGEEAMNGAPVPTWEMPVMNVDKQSKSGEVRKQGSYASMTDVDKAMYNPWEPEFHEALKVYYDRISGASMTTQDFPTLNNVNLTGVLINNTQRQYSIQNACTVENTTDITFREYAVTRFQIEAEVGELSRTEPKKMSFSKTEFLMRKSQGEIQWSDEFLMQNYLFDPLALARANMTSDAERVKATKILLLLNAFNDTAGNDLTSFVSNTNRSNYNPIRAVGLVRMSIEQTNFGRIDTGVINPVTEADWLSNSFVRDLSGGNQVLATDPGTSALPGLTGIQVYVDPLVPIGVLHLYDKRYLIRKQGPVRTEQYRIPQIGANGLIYRDYNNAYIRDLSTGATLTTLSPP